MILLSRAEMLKHVSTESAPGVKPPAPEELELWYVLIPIAFLPDIG